jgi:hypothetical protein
MSICPFAKKIQSPGNRDRMRHQGIIVHLLHIKVTLQINQVHWHDERDKSIKLIYSE